MTAPIGIYIHIPYCRVLCPYCDFVKARTSGNVPVEFTDALISEINAYTGTSTVQSIFLGGGTPSLLSPEDMQRLFQTINQKFSLTPQAEITIEANPDDITSENLNVWKQVGINRVSLGVQSFDDNVLQFLGRNHSAETAQHACTLLSNTFDNWGLDLIFGAKPGDAWVATLDKALTFNPPHISAYSLTYEEGTPFWQTRSQALPDDDALDHYRLTRNVLKSAGYNHYEISNFAKPGCESFHNKIYWRNEEYAGFGPGAVSWLANTRSRNVPGIRPYLENPTQKLESLNLTSHEIQTETLIQYFRTAQGLDKDSFKNRFNSDLSTHWKPTLESLCDRGLLEATQQGFRPTVSGFELNDEIGLALVSAAPNSSIEKILPPR